MPDWPVREKFATGDWQSDLTAEEIEQILKALGKISEDDLQAEFAPADGVRNDSAYMYSLTFELDDKLIESDFFDFDNPPSSIEPLISVLSEILTRITTD